MFNIGQYARHDYVRLWEPWVVLMDVRFNARQLINTLQANMEIL